MTKSEQETILNGMTELINCTAKELARRMLNAELIFPHEELREVITAYSELRMRHYLRQLADDINLKIQNEREPLSRTL